MAVRVRNRLLEAQPEELTRQHESTRVIWFIRSYGDVDLLRARKSQPVVYPGVRGGVCIRVGLRISTRGLAVRIGGGYLVHCGRAAMVDCRGTIRLNRSARHSGCSPYGLSRQ